MTENPSLLTAAGNPPMKQDTSLIKECFNNADRLMINDELIIPGIEIGIISVYLNLITFIVQVR